MICFGRCKIVACECWVMGIQYHFVQSPSCINQIFPSSFPSFCRPLTSHGDWAMLVSVEMGKQVHRFQMYVLRALIWKLNDSCIAFHWVDGLPRSRLLGNPSVLLAFEQARMAGFRRIVLSFDGTCHLTICNNPWTVFSSINVLVVDCIARYYSLEHCCNLMTHLEKGFWFLHPAIFHIHEVHDKKWSSFCMIINIIWNFILD